MRAGSVPLTGLVGRVEERRDVLRVLEQHRLVTLTGIGGVGKTRLARAVADDYPGEAVWVDLTAVDEPELVAPTVGRALGVAEAPRSDPAAMVVEAVGHCALLLVVDNCEHLIDSMAGLVEEWLSSCPSLRVLATSRESLRSAAERVWPVPPLAVEPAGEELPDGVRLFVERARAAGALVDLTDETIDRVASLCRRLDGIPLAIELAAARVRPLGLSQLREALDDALGVLTSGPRTAAERHRTLERSLAWSYDLIDERERALLRRLSVFASEISVAGAAAVCSGEPISTDSVLDLVATLVDKSMLQASFRGDQPRYRLLEVVRQFARRQLDAAGETDLVKDRHAAWVAGECERRGRLLFGDGVFEVLDELEAELDDVRAAAAWTMGVGDHDLALRVLSAPLLFWICRHPVEGRRTLEEALAAGGNAAPRTLAAARVALSWLCFYIWDDRAAETHARTALALASDVGDRVLVAQAGTLVAWTMLFLEPEMAVPALVAAAEECRAVGDGHHLAHAIAGLGFSAAHQARTDEALERWGESLDVAREVGDQIGIRRALAFSGAVLAVRGAFAEAEVRFAETERITRRLGDRYFLTQALDYLGFIALHRGDIEAARGRIDESLKIAQQSSAIALCRSHTMTALLELAVGEFDRAVLHADRAVAIVRDVGVNWHFSMTYGVAAEAYRGLGHVDEADRLCLEGVGVARAVGLPWAEATAEVATGRADGLLRAIGWFVRLGHVPELLRALDTLAGALDDTVEVARLLGGTAAARARLGLQVFPADQARLAELAHRGQAALGEHRWTAEFGRGGEQCLDDLAGRVLRGRGPRRRPASGWDSLTPAEQRVAELAAAGLRNTEIAEKLFVTPGTVKLHLSHVFAKVGVRTRTELSAAYTRRRVE